MVRETRLSADDPVVPLSVRPGLTVARTRC